MFEAIVLDVRSALRLFRTQRAFAAIVIITLALGVGANTAILSVVYAVLFKPLPYADAANIFSVEAVIPERREQIPSLPATVQAFLEWRRAGGALSGIAAMRPWEASITGDGGEPERLGGARVSANFFGFLGVPLALGRGFAADEEQPGRERVVVISHALWRARYASDAGVIGRTIVLNSERHAVVGIASPSLLVPTGTQLHPLLPFAPRVDIWKPIAPTPQELEGESWDHGVLVRIGGASVERGRQQLGAVLNEMIRRQAPDVKTEIGIRLVPIREAFAGRVRLRLILVLAASALLLLTACASVANVLLARVASRANEFATRIALGAGRGRIIGHALTESVLLAIAGGAFGAAIARYGVEVLSAYGPDEVRRLTETGTSAPFLLLAITVSLATGALCGIVPAWQAYRRHTHAALQEGARAVVSGYRAERSRRVLVGAEIAFATVLLASAGLLLHSFVNVLNADRGYDVERVLAVDLSLFGQRYSAAAARTAFYGELLGRVRSLPGVVAAGAVSNLPAVATSEGASRTIFDPADTDFRSVVLKRPVAMIRGVTAGYFSASGTALLAGRFVADSEPAPVAVISESLAARLWPGDRPAAAVGRWVRQGDVTGPLIAVAGVVADVRPGGLEREPAPAVYRPYAQWASGPMTLVIRTAQEPAAVAAAVRAQIRALDSGLPIASMRTMRDIVSSAVAQRRFQLTLTSLFGVVALLLGAVGVYGVVSYAVACRTRDIGVRMALGAQRTDVMRSVFANGMKPALCGLAVGLIGTVAAARAVRGVLFGIAPTDPVSLGAVALVLLLTSTIACYVPSRRAASLDPMVALRNE